MLKLFFRSLVWIIGASVSHVSGQQLASFDQIPANRQLYARAEDRTAVVPISGKMLVSGYNYVSVVTFRNNARVGYQRFKLAEVSNTSGSFSLSPKIKAELAEYAFEIYAVGTKDSSLLARRDNIVAGDFFIIYGQSNAVAWEVDYQYRHEFARSYGFEGWGLSNERGPRVGIFGIEFQRVIAERYNMPTCVINGAVAGAFISSLVVRNTVNRTDTSTPYGSLLNYAKATGLLPHVRGMFYWQGEAEASSDHPEIWAPGFDQLIKIWKEDYPSTEKVYVFQLPLFGGGQYDDRIGAFREQQRTLDRKYPIVQPYAALGGPGWNGFHYALDGYLKLGQELADMAGFYHYGEKEKVTSPNLQKAYFSTPNHDEVTMVFEDYQVMRYPKDSTYANIPGSLQAESVYSVKDFFFLNGVWQKLSSGRAQANRIIMKLKEPAADSTIKYLPSKYHFSGLLTAPWVYVGPFISNSKGFRALAFHHNKIYPYTAYDVLKLEATEQRNQIELSWNKIPNVKGYLVERIVASDSTQTPEVWTVSASVNTYVDATAKGGVTYQYRVRGLSDFAETAIASATVTKIDNDPQFLRVFPNPTAGLTTIEAKEEVKSVELFAKNGVQVKRLKIISLNPLVVDLANLPQGEYVLKCTLATRVTSVKILIL